MYLFLIYIVIKIINLKIAQSNYIIYVLIWRLNFMLSILIGVILVNIEMI
jgi:hypothetical protein